MPYSDVSSGTVSNVQTWDRKHLQPNSHHCEISGVLADLSKRESEDGGTERLWASPKMQTDVATQLPRGVQTIAGFSLPGGEHEHNSAL